MTREKKFNVNDLFADFVAKATHIPTKSSSENRKLHIKFFV
jgi:hypothetical protein